MNPLEILWVTVLVLVVVGYGVLLATAFFGNGKKLRFFKQALATGGMAFLILFAFRLLVINLPMWVMIVCLLGFVLYAFYVQRQDPATSSSAATLKHPSE